MHQLLEKIKIVNKYQNRINKISDERFNIFRICGVNHYETTHSSILTELLNNNSSHNFGTKFLEAFIDTLKFDNIIPEEYNFQLQDIKVIPEYSVNSMGRIDIMIKNSTQCIIIENKIYASDQYEQLKRYEKFAKSSFQESLLLYLTLWGDEASEQSAKGVDYRPISYENTITNWLERCISISARNPVIRETLIQYINHINHLTNKTSQNIMNKEIVELLSNEENIDALFTIGENFNNVRNHIVNKVFIPQLDKVCSELGLINISKEYDRVNTAWSSFLVSHPKWEYFRIGFEFEAKGLRNLITGIQHIDVNNRKDETFEVLKPMFNRQNNNWVWSDFPKYTNWNKEAMTSIYNGEMATIFKSELIKIMDKTNGLSM